MHDWMHAVPAAAWRLRWLFAIALVATVLQPLGWDHTVRGAAGGRQWLRPEGRRAGRAAARRPRGRRRGGLAVPLGDPAGRQPVRAAPGRGDAPAPGLDALTDREREMLGWVATGRSNQEIAKELFLSPATVRTHISRAMGKLGARDRAQLGVFAVRAGLVLPEE
jgi:DNA-binding NarL/FixJ family response regulator